MITFLRAFPRASLIMTKRRTCGRGVLGLETFKPCRRPGQAPDPNCVAQPICTASIKAAQDETRGTVKANENGDERPTAAKEQTVPTPPVQHGKSPVEMLAKYSYQANPDRPGGFDEMSIKQGQKLEFIQAHSNPFWWEVRNEMEEVAFVPASYMLVLEKKVSALPWLENKALEEEKERQEQERKNAESGGAFGGSPSAAFKPYNSAYVKDSSGQPQSSREFYCDLCDKQLNGLKPYQAHMVSKGHKEEMALLD